METRTVVVSGIVAGIVVLVLSMIISAATQALFGYNVLTLAGMRSVNDPVSILFFVHPFVVALAVAILYDFAKKSFTGGTTKRNCVEAAWMDRLRHSISIYSI